MKIKNISDSNQRLLFKPVNDSATIDILDKTYNPTLDFSDNGDFYFCLSSSSQTPPEGQIDEDEIETTTGWALITFDELGVANPSYTITHPDLGTVRVTTGASFIGQSIMSDSIPYTIIGSPLTNTELRIDREQQFYAVIKEDSANPNTPILSGSFNYDSPVSVLFSVDVHAVGLTGGFFDSINSTYIEVYDRLGNIVGRAANTQTGIETFGFSTGAQAKIAGFSFYVNGDENAGFALDNLRFK